MNFFEQRRYKKIVKHMQHEARHARHMRLDIAPPEELESLLESAEPRRLG